MKLQPACPRSKTCLRIVCRHKKQEAIELQVSSQETVSTEEWLDLVMLRALKRLQTQMQDNAPSPQAHRACLSASSSPAQVNLSQRRTPPLAEARDATHPAKVRGSLAQTAMCSLTRQQTLCAPLSSKGLETCAFSKEAGALANQALMLSLVWPLRRGRALRDQMASLVVVVGCKRSRSRYSHPSGRLMHRHRHVFRGSTEK